MKNNIITWIAISTHALKHNLKQFRKIIPQQTGLMAVVKSNAYGHGLVEVAKIAKSTGVKWLATVNLEEALELRKNGIRGRILILGYFNPEKLKQAVALNITLTIYSYRAALLLNKIGKQQKKVVTVHFKVDTGTSRLGILTSNCIPLIKKIYNLPYIKLEGIFSHFADAENFNQNFTNAQISKFNQLINQLEKHGLSITLKHFACSAATILNQQSHYDLVRIGISMYGLWSINTKGRQFRIISEKISLKSALSWHTKIVQIKILPRNTYIGYGRTKKTKKDTVLAVIPVGYWDGYDRKLSNTGDVLIHGKRCPVVGRVCMNLTMIDISKIRAANVGDKVTLLGKSGADEITAEEIAESAKTINYEIIARINPLIPRIYN